uniref:Uncharacterized protein n=1 Tax=Parastrongyloides trichosuri TaxID=131310 RepID=A0A0N4Z072_PARTI
MDSSSMKPVDLSLNLTQEALTSKNDSIALLKAACDLVELDKPLTVHQILHNNNSSPDNTTDQENKTNIFPSFPINASSIVPTSSSYDVSLAAAAALLGIPQLMHNFTTGTTAPYFAALQAASEARDILGAPPTKKICFNNDIQQLSLSKIENATKSLNTLLNKNIDSLGSKF